MNLSLYQYTRTFVIGFACAGLLSACGGGSGGNGGYKPGSSAMAYSSTAVSVASSVALSSPAPSSAAPSSTPTSSTSVSSSVASSAGLMPPVALVDSQLNALDGDYFVAKGQVLVGVPEVGDTGKFVSEVQNREGFSLYTFDNDPTGVGAVCHETCAVNWPPLLASEQDIATAPYSIMERNLNPGIAVKQWAYQGKPLYFFKGDSLAGQTNGKAISTWRLARPLPVQLVANATLGSHLGAVGSVKIATSVNGSEQTSTEQRSGFSLYTFLLDSPGVSNCTGTCLSNWPALMAHAGAVASAPYTLVQRASGEMQWALNGMPLYFFAGDTAAGQVNGEAIGNNWYVARTVPVAVHNHATKNRLLMAQGSLINASGAVDNTRQNFTLYTFDPDPIGQITCFDGCLVVWPALYAPADAQDFGDFSTIVRDYDTGIRQWAYKGKALYFYIGDTAAGQVTGEYTDWTIARP